LCLALETATPLRQLDEFDVHAGFRLLPGESATFVLEQVPERYVPRKYSDDETREAFERTVDYWRRWLSKSNYTGRWRETRHRSAADHVRDRRPERSGRGDPRALRGVPRLAAGADRKRRGHAAPAGHLRRDDRLGVPLQQVRRADLARLVDGADPRDRVDLRA